MRAQTDGMVNALGDDGRGWSDIGAPMVHAVVVNRNGAELLVPCLRHLLACGYPRLRVTVVDNASSDDSAQEACSLFPQITLLRNEKNLGFAGGANLGVLSAVECGAQYIWVLNNDVFVPPSCLEGLVSLMESNPGLGACQPVMVFADDMGTVQSAGCCLGLTGRCWDLAAWTSVERLGNDLAFPAAVTGAAMLLRVGTLDNSDFFDERFFMYFEDVDLCLRLMRKGYGVACLSGIRAAHKGGGTSAEMPVWRKIFLCERNALILAGRHYPATLALTALILGPLSALAAALLRLFLLQPSAAAAYVCGSLAGLPPALLELTRRLDSNFLKEVSIAPLISRNVIFPPSNQSERNSG